MITPHMSSGKPRIILGTMTFGPDEKGGARITSMDDYNSCLDTLQSWGSNEIDTARAYIAGKQESWSAQAGVFDRGLTVATKCYPMGTSREADMGNRTHRPEDLRKSVQKSLSELDQKTVDIFYLHAADRTTPFEETLAECDKMHKEGKFVQLGLSNFTAFEVAECVMLCRQHGWVKPTIYQGMYNAIARGIEPELIPACRRYGLDIVVYNPVAGGLFSGKYSAADLKSNPQEGRFSDAVGIMGQRYRERYFKDSTFASLELIESAVKKHDLTMIETAFRWLIHHAQLRFAKDGGNDGLLIGVSSEEQLKTNLACIDKGPLPQEVVEALDEAWLISKARSANYWHLDLKYTYDTKKALFG